MDLSEEKSGMEKSDCPMNYTTSDWQLGCASFMNPPVNLVPPDGSMLNPSMGSSVSFEDSLCPSIWDRRGGEFLTATVATTLPQSLSPFPVDSTFIERAARFSCFDSAGTFSNMMMYPLGVSEPVDHSSNGGSIQASQVLSSANASKATSVLQSLGTESRLVEADDNASPVADHWPAERSPVGIGQGGNLDSMDEGKLGNEASNNVEAPFSAAREAEAKILVDPSVDVSAKRFAANKRKRGSGLLEPEQRVQLSSIKTTKENTEAAMRGEQNPKSTASKFNAQQGKENSQNSDAPKEDYIHVRARRGQATNSHSLAERVRREKISERMKYLQDLVPGCSKVTGKAVMLDEIINYVQSLQRQVEFLSMKLAAVNPQIDLNFEGLLSKDIHQARGIPSTVRISPDMGISYPQLHPSSHRLIQGGIPGIGSHSDLLRRTINSQLTTTNAYKEMTLQTGNAWDEGLQNVVRMSFGMNAPLNVQELNGSLLPSALMKAEP